MTNDDRLLMEFAGFAMAHALWSVREGALLVTFALFDVHGKRSLARFPDQPIPDSIKNAEALLKKLPEQAQRWSIAFDGYMRFSETERHDAIWIKFGSSTSAATGNTGYLYVPKSEQTAFALRRGPIFQPLDNIATAETESMRIAVVNGMRSHERAWKEIGAESIHGSI